MQWLQVTDIKERYVLMSEPDHVWLRPMPNLMTGDIPAAFPFFYIEPAKPEFRPITEKFTGKLTLKQAESIAPIGGLLLDLMWCTCICVLANICSVACSASTPMKAACSSAV